MIARLGRRDDDGQTLTRRPRRSNVSEPHSDGGRLPDDAADPRPSGPAIA